MTREELLIWRRANKLTQRQLAVHLGVSMQTVANWEVGRHKLPDDIISRLPNKPLVVQDRPNGRPPKEKRHPMFDGFPDYAWTTHLPWSSWDEVKLWLYFRAAAQMAAQYQEPTPQTLQAAYDERFAYMRDNTSGGARLEAWENEQDEFERLESTFNEKRQMLIDWLKQNGMDHALRA